MNLRTVLVLLFTLVAAPLGRADFSTQVNTDPGSGVSIEITSPFDKLPPHGRVPIRVKVSNRSGARRSWDVNFNSATYDNLAPRSVVARQTISAEANSEKTFELFAPLSAEGDYKGSSQLSIGVRGYGVNPGWIAGFPTNYLPNVPTVFFLMSQALIPKWADLDKHLGEAGRTLSLRGSEVNPARLPQDWRAYTGVEVVWLTAAEWDKLGPAQRGALKDWVAQGGRLRLFGESSAALAADFGYRDSVPAKMIHGFGDISVLAWNGKTLPVKEAGGLIIAETRSRDAAGRIEHGDNRQVTRSHLALQRGDWGLREGIAAARINLVLFLAFVVCFAVVVGPVNLFLWAGAGRRHRLFWTTPLVSIAASVLLSVLIVVQDGFGGYGNRFAARLLLPAENKEYLFQEQLSRTGALLGAGFTLNDPAHMEPLTLPPNLTGRSTRGRLNLSVSGDTYGGNWFASRAVQGQLIEAAVPTRARITLLPGQGPDAAPAVASSVEAALSVLFFIDDAGNYWRGEGLHAGQKQTLKPASAHDFEAWWSKLCGDAGTSLRLELQDAGKRRGYFYATAGKARGIAMETLRGIRWKRDTAVLLGPVSRE